MCPDAKPALPKFAWNKSSSFSFPKQRTKRYHKCETFPVTLVIGLKVSAKVSQLQVILSFQNRGTLFKQETLSENGGYNTVHKNIYTNRL